MTEEIVIIEVKPKIYDINTFDCEPGTFSVRTNFERELYEVNQPISYKPKFLAIRDPDTCQVELLYRIDLTKSEFEKGQITPLGKPLTKVHIPLKVSRNRSLMHHKIWYTSFEKLLTHNSTDEFTEEKSQIITRVIIEDQRVLCNGSSCNHIIYCKFFNHSQNLIIKSSEVTD